jgi:hypothetical protein
MKNELNGNTLLFAVFCVESIAERLEMSGTDVYKLLTKDNNILDTYIIEFYDTLHTQGKEYIVDDVIELMRKEGVL